MGGGRKRGGEGGGGGRGGGGGGRGGGNAPAFDFGKGPITLTQAPGGRGGPQVSQAAQAALLPLLQKKMNSLVGKSSGYFESLPQTVQRRVRALKKLQNQHDKLEEELRKEQEALDAKYEALRTPLYNRRSDIVNGGVEPTDDELAEIKVEEKKEGEQETKTEKKEETAEEKNLKGIPEFWLQVLKHQDDFAEMISEADEGVLKHLIEVKYTNLPNEATPTPSFVLEFHFSPNEYFDEQILKKTYVFSEDDPVSGPMLEEIKGMDITWKEGKNVSVKMVTKKQQVGGNKRGKRGGKGGRGSQGQVKTVTVEEPVPSFFHFFKETSLPEVGSDEEDSNTEEEFQEILESDYELGMILKNELIPEAVKWFTGEAVNEMGGDDDEDGEDGEDDDEDEGNAQGGDGEEYNSDEDEEL